MSEGVSCVDTPLRTSTLTCGWVCALDHGECYQCVCAISVNGWWRGAALFYLQELSLPPCRMAWARPHGHWLQGYNDRFYKGLLHSGTKPTQEPVSKSETGGVPMTLLGFCLKGHKLTFDSYTWPSSWSLPSMREERPGSWFCPTAREKVSLFFLSLSISDSLAESLRRSPCHFCESPGPP